ncbi:ATP-binding protein [Streptantibioticus parmotrematis]|uniref:ATP-binding protein n=1 Tax=Streptantibioticus parmotrematis TaxID=2873249 RepID=UPI0033EA6507
MLRSDPSSVRLAREFTKVALSAGERGDVAASLVPVVSELVTNSVVHHTGPFSASIHLRLLTCGTTIRLEVHDDEPALPAPRTATSPNDESGRGLHIVAALTTRWGCFRTNTDKCVWCEIDAGARPAPGGGA